MTAPGGHIVSKMPCDSHVARTYPESNDVGNYLVMSGTSQAAAVVSGVAALMLEVDGSLTPDDLKCRLMKAARVAADPGSQMAYSLFQQGRD